MPRSRKGKGSVARDRSYVEDMFDAAEHIVRYVNGVTFAEFAASELLQDAILRRLTIIGEAASCVSPEFQTSHAKVNWKNIIALRNLVVHRYWSVDRDIVWKIVLDDVPKLLDDLHRIQER